MTTSEKRYYVKALDGTEHKVWILRWTDSDDGQGAWVCTAITPEEEEAGESPGEPEWVDAESIEERSDGRIPAVDPRAYDRAAIKSLAQRVLDLLGGGEQAAKKLSWNHYLTLCCCASFIVEDDDGE